WREWRRSRQNTSYGACDSPIADNWVTNPLVWGCVIGFVITAAVGVAGAGFGESEIGAGVFIKDYMRLAAKQTLPGLTALAALRYLTCRGWKFPEQGNRFLILAFLYCFYM